MTLPQSGQRVQLGTGGLGAGSVGYSIVRKYGAVQQRLGRSRSDGGLAAFGFECRALNISGAPGSWSVTVGPVPISYGPYVNASGGTGFEAPCGTNMVGTRLAGSYQNGVDRVRLDCSPINAYVP